MRRYKNQQVSVCKINFKNSKEDEILQINILLSQISSSLMDSPTFKNSTKNRCSEGKNEVNETVKKNLKFAAANEFI